MPDTPTPIDPELVEYMNEEYAHFVNDYNLFDPETGKVNG